MMKEESFDINKTKCGPNGRCALAFALGVEDDPIHEETVKMVLSVLVGRWCLAFLAWTAM